MSIYLDGLVLHVVGALVERRRSGFDVASTVVLTVERAEPGSGRAPVTVAPLRRRGLPLTVGAASENGIYERRRAGVSTR